MIPSKVLAAATLVTAAAAVIAPLSAPLGVLLVAALQLAHMAGRERLTYEPSFLGLGMAGLWGFVGLALVSFVWSKTPVSVPLPVLLMAGLIVGAHFLVTSALKEPAEGADALMRGLLVGFTIGLGYLAIDLIGDMPLRRIYLSGMPVDSYDRQLLNRSIAVIVMLCWPVVLGCRVMLRGAPGKLSGIGVVATVVLLALMSEHETAKLAILASLPVFAVASLAPWLADRMLTLGWIAAALLVVPLGWFMYHGNLHDARWVPRSAQSRIVIWGYTAEQVVKSPIVGHGANSTRDEVLTERRPSEREAAGHHTPRTIGHHSHNIFMQIWYELGLAGALLWLGAGLGVLGFVFCMESAARPFGMAAFGAVFVQVQSSYGFWQTWLQGVMVLVAVALALGARLSTLHRLAGPRSERE